MRKAKMTTKLKAPKMPKFATMPGEQHTLNMANAASKTKFKGRTKPFALAKNAYA